MALYGFRPRAFAHFERSKARSAKIEKLGLAPSHSFNFCASLHQERFTKWSKRHSFGSHKSFPATWITEHYSENHYKEQIPPYPFVLSHSGKPRPLGVDCLRYSGIRNSYASKVNPSTVQPRISALSPDNSSPAH